MSNIEYKTYIRRYRAGMIRFIDLAIAKVADLSDSERAERKVDFISQFIYLIKSLRDNEIGKEGHDAPSRDWGKILLDVSTLEEYDLDQMESLIRAIEEQ